MSAYTDVRKHKKRFAIYKYDSKTNSFLVETQGDLQLGHAEFKAALPEDECRYAVCFFEFPSSEGTSETPVFFVIWTPDSASGMVRYLVRLAVRSIPRPAA